jgi:methionine synthase I (cobalamin-dependent)
MEALLDLLRSLLEEEHYLVLDGAMGTMLMNAGLESGACPELWNVEQPEKVRAIHRAYIEAGSRVLLTNSFGGSRIRLKQHNLENRVAELNRAAAQNLRAEADRVPQTIIVAGSIGPTGELMEPLGKLTFEAAREAFTEQAAALAEGGVDIFWIETMSDISEVQAAVQGARSASELPIAATMTFDARGRTMMGVSPQKAVETLHGLDILVMGANCGTGPAEFETIIQTMKAAAPEAFLVAKANAGLPKMVGTDLVYDGTPDVMAAYAVQMRDLGARLIGACCGSTPAHIRAMVRALSEK